MSVAELQAYTAVSKYARWLEDRKRRETWPETVRRSEEMMVGRFPRLEGRIRQAYRGVEQMRWLGSQRLLQYAGEPALRRNARGFNCWGTFCDRLRVFPEMFYLLLCGGGTGFSIQKHHVEHLPRLSLARRQGRILPIREYDIDDSIEGWADSAAVLLSSFHEEPIRGFEDYHDCEVVFRYHKIRRKGAPLSYGIGRAPGPDPLRRFHERGLEILREACRLGLERLRPIDCLDFACHQSDAVMSGGVRRSAGIAIFSLDDLEVLSAKTGDWWPRLKHRARFNNSVALVRGQTSWEDFSRLWEFTRQFGEPGLLWCYDTNIVSNPCGEVGWDPRIRLCRNDLRLEKLLRTYQGPVWDLGGGVVGLSGWGDCNLCTISGKSLRSRDDFLEACEETALIGTLQATFTDLGYLGPVSEEISRHEALIGVAIGGVMHAPQITLDPGTLEEGVRRVLMVNEEVAQKVGINPAARTTLGKPDGNCSCLLGGEPGANGAHSARYFRLSRASELEAPFRHFQAVNPTACEPTQGEKPGEWVIRFCVETPPGTILKENISARQSLDNILTLYRHWVRPGTRPERSLAPHLTHNLSNTIPVRDHEWEEVKQKVFAHQEGLAGLTFLADSGDLDYAQAPYTRVRTPAEQETLYGRDNVKMACELLRPNHFPFNNPWEATPVLLGWSEENTPRRKEFVHRLRSWAEESLGGDLRQADHCLKDAWLWALWTRLRADFQPVDYTTMIEETPTLDLRGEQACAGGQCQMV